MARVERPLLILPTGSESVKAKKGGGGPAIARPSHSRQCERLSPQFDRLNRVFEERRSELLALRRSSDGIEPELALVFETIGSGSNFLSAVKRIEGLEWMAEYSIEGIEPDEDFFDEKHPQMAISEKVYCVMSDQQALKELLGKVPGRPNDQVRPWLGVSDRPLQVSEGHQDVVARRPL